MHEEADERHDGGTRSLKFAGNTSHVANRGRVFESKVVLLFDCQNTGFGGKVH